MRIPVHAVTVLDATWVSPRMRRVTFGGDDLADFASEGLADERIKLFVPPAGETRPVLPSWDGEAFRWPEGAPRPLSRTFTVRRYDAARRMLDVDIADHDGPAAAWARACAPGDGAGVAGPGGGYELVAARHVLAGDEAALPAIATIVERLPEDATADVVVEVRDADGEIALDSRAEIRVRWIHRDGAGAGARLVEAVTANGLTRGDVHVWAAGESLAMRAIRRHLRDEVGLPRDRYRVLGYWRERLSEDEAIETHLAAVAAAEAAGGDEAAIEDAGLY